MLVTFMRGRGTTGNDGLTGLQFFACLPNGVWASREMAPLLHFSVAWRRESGVMDRIEHSSTGPWRLSIAVYGWTGRNKMENGSPGSREGGKGATRSEDKRERIARGCWEERYSLNSSPTGPTKAWKGLYYPTDSA
ncbi:hypothetical protein GLAREA_05337 [Glarea lozoyensis ATCC 20868]|uniref:Uncharacterized protein n=1 Tax=Glarea lozoyensis (strain ATCC 20868 / MF5171) TaxID=1116229 RepID=S3DFT0_GLAL2|nr:uncharacterized protein GLAREA_05337 [Glarea lozoyensis ATCC 20868]EPE35999.1 hypothetical protein GLAREA_05337 [Glarea lozoyensis ATCC 20868]